MLKKLKNEDGFALVLSLLIMAAMTAIGMAAMMTSTTDIMIARNEREAKKAFYLAESGVEEAAARIKLSSTNARYIGEMTNDATYRQTTWNANNALGRNFGKDGAATRRSIDNLDYSVTINYLTENNMESLCDSNDASPNTTANSEVPPAACDNDPAELVLFGQDFNVPATVTRISRGNLPVYQITSTARSGNSSATVVAIYGASALNTDTEFGLNTNACIDVQGGANNLGTVVQGAGCVCDPQLTGVCAANKAASDNMDTYLGDQLSEIISFANERHLCKGGTCNNAGDDIPSSGSIDNVVQDWGDAAGDSYSTMIYIDNDTGREVTINGNFTGRGILIVTGDLRLSGNLTYEGLVYVFGTLTIAGGGSQLNVTGGIMANNTVSINGGVTVQYDQAILNDVARQNSSSAILAWKRL